MFSLTGKKIFLRLLTMKEREEKLEEKEREKT